MAAFVKSIERVSTTFSATTTPTTNTVNLSKGQDETKCVPFYTHRFTGSGSADTRQNMAVRIQMIDNSGTAACSVHMNQTSSAGPIAVEITVVEFGSNVTVQQNSSVLSITGTSATATITSVNQGNSFIVFNQAGSSGSGSDDWNDTQIQSSFNSNTEIAFERRAAGNPDWDLWWYVVESNGTDFQTEYEEVSWTSNQTGPTNQTLANSATLANSFLICSYETSETADDMRDAVCNFALTGTTTLTWYRNHGGTPSATGTYGVWVVRSDSNGCNVQRFATDCQGQLTTNQTITSVDLTKAGIIDSQSTGYKGWAIDSTTGGSNIEQRQHTVTLTSATNVALQRRADTSINGSNNNFRYEVIEFEIESLDTTITAEAGSFSWAGQNASILEALRVSAESGAYAWSGQNAGIIRDLRVSAESGSYSWSGSAAGILVDEIISAAAGSYSWAGQNAEILRSLLLSAESGSYSWAGQDAGILKSTPIPVEAGSYSWAGADAGIIRDLTISAESGTYSWTGANAGLVRDLLVAAQGATYAWAGDDAGINISLLIAAEGGAYTWTGQDAALLVDHIIQAAAAGYTWAGQDAAINVAGFTTIIAEAGSYSWAGQDAGLLLDRIINAESGSWTWNGQAANIVLSGAAVRPQQEDFFIGIRIGI